MPDMSTMSLGGYTKLHVRAKDGGNTKVAGLIVAAKKARGSIISMLDNTGSITSMPNEAFYYCNEDDDMETGFFMNPDIVGGGFVEDISGMIFPDFTSEGCYYMFAEGQTTLTKIPAVLPAKHVDACSYGEMFCLTGLCEVGGELSILAENLDAENSSGYFDPIGDYMFGDITGSNKFSVHVHTCNDHEGNPLEVADIAGMLGICQSTNVYAVDENGNEYQNTFC